MPKFQCVARDVTFWEITVEADTMEEAVQIARDTDPDGWTCTNDGYWDYEHEAKVVVA